MGAIKENFDEKISWEKVFNAVIQIPGVKVNRKEFLDKQFQDSGTDKHQLILEQGVIEAGCTKPELKDKSEKLIMMRTAESSGASLLAGLPGGIAMAATIPADVIQFYGVALRMAQELAYLYGEEDLWENKIPEKEVANRLMLYCGVMLGVSGATQAVRVLSSALAKQAIKKLPQKALTKMLIFRIIRSIAKVFGIRMTKEVFAKSVAKIVPVVGGVVCGTVTWVTMRPMGRRLREALEESKFNYSEERYEKDVNDIAEILDAEIENNLYREQNDRMDDLNDTPVLEKIQQAKEMMDGGVITEQEFREIKEKLISSL